MKNDCLRQDLQYVVYVLRANQILATILVAVTFGMLTIHRVNER